MRLVFLLAAAVLLTSVAVVQSQNTVDCPVDLVFLLDRSGSICKDEHVFSCQSWTDAKNFLIQLVDELEMDNVATAARVALITFDSKATVQWDLLRYQRKTDLTRAIRDLAYTPWQETYTADALRMMMRDVFGNNGDRRDAGNAVVMVTDGLPTVGEQRDNTVRLAENAHDAGIEIFVIGVTDRISVPMLKEISSYPHENFQNYFTSPNFQYVSTLASQVRQGFCDVEPVVECPVDMAILLDRSGSICNGANVRSCQSWIEAKQFLNALVDGMQIGNSATSARVALITFDNEAILQWNLDRYVRREQLKRAIESLEYIPNRETFTHEALELMMREVFGSHHSTIGNRPVDVIHAHIAVILTDGLPTQYDRTVQAALDAAGQGIKLFAIGVTDTISVNALSQLSSYPQQLNRNYFTSPDYAHVNTLVDQLREETCEYVPVVECPVDLALLLDRSGSICNDQNVPTCQSWTDAKQFMIALVESIEVGNDENSARVALIIFDSAAELRWNLNRYLNKADLINAIRRLEYKPNQETYTHDALELMMREVFGSGLSIGNRPSTSNIIARVAVILTDGLPTFYDRTVRAAEEATDAGIQVFTVGVTRTIDANMLSKIASFPHRVGQNYFTSPDYSNVVMLVGQVRQGTCEPPPTVECPVDLALLLDRSGSICGDLDVPTCDNWDHAKQFLQVLVDGMEIGSGARGARIALITFGSGATIEWNFDKFQNKATLIDKIKNLVYRPNQETYTHEAVDIMMRDVFGPRHVRVGDRPSDVEHAHAAIILTDGRPTEYDKTLDAVKRAFAGNVKIFAVGVTKNISANTLSLISSDPHKINENYFTSDDFSFAVTLIRQVRVGTCQTGPIIEFENECPVDLTLLLDRSGSICGGRNVRSCQSWDEAKQFLVALVDGMRIGNSATSARVALITFDDNAILRWNLDRYLNKEDLKRAINGLEYTPFGGTNTHGALELMMREIFGPIHSSIGHRVGDGLLARVAVILTDGLPTQYERTLQVALEVTGAGVELFAVGVTDTISVSALSQLSSYPHQLDRNYFTSPDYSTVNTLVGQVREQTCDVEAVVECPVDLALLLDRSGSICNDEDVPSCQSWTEATQFLIALVESIEVGNDEKSARVALIIFDSTAVLRWNLNRYLNKADLLNAIRRLEYKPNQETYTHDALELMMREIFGPGRSIGNRPSGDIIARVAVILTDGLPTFYDRTVRAAEDATDAGVQIYTVGVTRTISADKLSQIASFPHILGQNYFTSASFSNVAMLVGQVRQLTCESEPSVECPVDLALLLDRSGSICGDLDVPTCDNWNHAKEFLQVLVRGMEIGSGARGARIALITFGSGATIEWNFDQFQNKATLIDKIKNLQYKPNQETYTHEAVDIMMRDVFGPSHKRVGDRPSDVEHAHAAIILTDGRPTEYDKTLDAVKRAFAGNVKIFAVGVTQNISANTLSLLSSDPHKINENYFTSDDFSFADTLIRQVRVGTCQAGPIIELENECPVDLALLLDRSGSICGGKDVRSCQSWDEAKQFLIALVDGMRIGNSATSARVALITFDDDAILQWNLDRYLNKEDLKRAINGLEYLPNRRTYTHEALELLMREVFGQIHTSIGHRVGDGLHAHIAVILTDGLPTQYERTLQLAAEVTGAGVQLFAVGVTDTISVNALSKLSSYPHQLDRNYFTSPDYAHVNTLVGQVREQTCDVEAVVDCPVDLALLLDRSGSICGDRTVFSCQSWTDAKQFLVSLIDGMQIGNSATSARVALIIFDSNAVLRWNLDRYINKEDLKRAIEDLEYVPNQETYTHEALQLMMREVFGPRHSSIGSRPMDVDLAKVAVILTDGLPTFFDRTVDAALDASAAGVQVYTVGVTRTIDANMLSKIASFPHRLGQNYFTSPDFANVAMLVSQVRELTCEPPPTVECPVDLALLLDRSGSICNDRGVSDCTSWSLAKQFLITLVDGMEIGPGTNGARVALITFGSRALLEWNLDQFQDKETLKRKIGDLQYEAFQTTYTHEALALATREVFGSRHNSIGNRPANIKHSHAVVILTDGHPTMYDKTMVEARNAIDAELQLFAVGVTNNISVETLSRLSSAPHKLNENFFTSTDFRQASTLVSKVREGACRTGTPPPTTRVCAIELVFIVDVSASVCNNQGSCQNWEYVKAFMVALVRSMTIGPQDTRVAMITFGDRARIRWNLNGYLNKDSLIDAIDRLSYEPRQMSTPSDALRLARNNIFHDANVRPNSQKVALFVIVDKPADSEQRENCAPEAIRCADAGISLVPIGITHSIAEYTLGFMSAQPRNPGSDYFRASEFRNLPSMVNEVLRSPAMSPDYCDNYQIQR